MSDLMAQAREIAATIEAKKAEAGAAWAQFDGLRKSAVAEGVDFAKDADAFEKIDAASKSYDAIRDEVATLEARRSRLVEMAGGSAPVSKAAEAAARSMGEAFVKSDAYRAAADRVSQSKNLPLGTTDAVKVADRGEVKTLFQITTNHPSLPVEQRTGLIVGTPLAGLDFLNVIASATTDSDLVEWVEETTLTNAAAETAETSSAPESAVAFTVRSAAVKEIAHFLPITRRAMADVAYVESWINNRLLDGVRRRLQTQVLSGNGSGENLTGIYNTSGIGVIDRSTLSVTMLDGLHKAITSVRVNSFTEPDFIGIHPEDYESLRLTREGAGSGQYLFGAPNLQGPVTLWGIPLVVHTAFTSGTPMVGKGSEATLWIREGVSVSASDSHSTYFIDRKVALLASMRAAFGVTQPKAFAICQA